MAGGGGNVVVLLPNGLSAFRFADREHYDVDTMVLAGEALRPFPCPAGSGETSLPARQPLTASDLRAALDGHTLSSDPIHMFPSRAYVALMERCALGLCASSVRRSAAPSRVTSS
jgi:hypothetical protein